MKKKLKPNPNTDRMMQNLLQARAAKKSWENKIVGWLFAGCLFMMGFIAGALIF